MSIAFREEIKTRVKLLKEFFGNWNIVNDLKSIFCTNCIAHVYNDVLEFRKKGTVDTEVDPTDEQILKDVITLGDLDSLNIEPIKSLEQLLDVNSKKYQIEVANLEMDQYWESVIIKGEAKRKKKFEDRVKFELEVRQVMKNRAALTIQMVFIKKIMKVRIKQKNQISDKTDEIRETLPSPSTSPLSLSISSRKIAPLPDQTFSLN